MMRIINIVLVVLMLGAATWTYNVKHAAERNLAEIRKLERKIALEKNTIDLLKADWAYLSQPARIQKLADQYADELKLRPTEPQQIVHPNELPAPPLVPKDDGIAEIIAGEMPDTMTTGSVEGD
ncbi:MAG: hypothetical protein Kow0026_15130 [Oricola sp.]